MEIGVFSALAQKDRRQLVALSKARSFGQNEVIFMQGEAGSGMYLIRDGKVKICASDSRGNELIFTFLSSDDLLGEIALLSPSRLLNCLGRHVKLAVEYVCLPSMETTLKC